MIEQKGPMGPSLFIHDVELPIKDSDVDKEMTATVKLKPRRVSTSKTNGKKSSSYDFEVTGIKFGA